MNRTSGHFYVDSGLTRTKIGNKQKMKTKLMYKLKKLIKFLLKICRRHAIAQGVQVLLLLYNNRTKQSNKIIWLESNYLAHGSKFITYGCVV